VSSDVTKGAREKVERETSERRVRRRRSRTRDSVHPERARGFLRDRERLAAGVVASHLCVPDAVTTARTGLGTAQSRHPFLGFKRNRNDELEAVPVPRVAGTRLAVSSY
jgi:hypothetical protein